MDIDYEAKEWRLFIDASKYSLKAVFLYNWNELPSIPVGHAVDMKQTYANLKKLLLAIYYERHNLQLCAVQKVVAILMGLHTGYIMWQQVQGLSLE